MKHLVLLFLSLLLSLSAVAVDRQRLNFNSGWLMRVGDIHGPETFSYDDAAWIKVSLPHAFNEAEAFKASIEQLSDTVVWYRKHFNIVETAGRKFFIELEGVRFGADLWLNGHHVGLTENGVMASGFDLTPYIVKGANVLAVRCDNSWNYHERATGSTFQWNNKNFNANYGGIPKNVFLHITGKVYQTLPLYSSLQTTGVYIYGTDYDIPHRAVTVHVESQVRNEDDRDHTVTLTSRWIDAEGKTVASFGSDPITLHAGETRTLTFQGRLHDVHFWSWGYGYLYTVQTGLREAGDDTVRDVVLTRTGFRKTRFAEGKIWLNDRVLMVHGYAQRSSNEWPGVGMSVPAWLSDYSNDLMVQSGGNLVRWMHVTPWKQDIESCDRVGLIQAMPAGDAEGDVSGRRWEQRKELMRDAIIYNRNNPSILFYECGNKGITHEHMREIKAIRDAYDPHGGRAIGSREMLDDSTAEYGGEMLYVNKSATKPMWMMEYHRDEGLRRYWDSQSYPFHPDGEGPLYRGKPAPEYNHNMDTFAASMVERWYDYYLERPGTGRRVNAGGAKIVFSDTNTHHRGEANYRLSGVVDAMRIPKDAFYAHQVMWDGWVTPEKDHTYIVGHWNYAPGTVKQTEYVVSTGDSVALFLNGKSLGRGQRSCQYLFTFKNIPYEPGTLTAVSYRDGKEVSRYSIETAGAPDHLRVTALIDPEGFRSDGADMALVQVEVVDKQGRRCPLDDRMLHFELQGKGEWLGGIAADASKGNYIRLKNLPLECGVSRVLLRSTTEAGAMTLRVSAEGLSADSVTLTTKAVDMDHVLPAYTLPCRLDRGETPTTPSYKDVYATVPVKWVKAGSVQEDAVKSCDDTESSEWKSDGKAENAWITYGFDGKQRVDEIAIKLTGWRNKSYPLAIYAGKKLVWQGWTYPTLGYCHLRIDKPVNASSLTIRMTAPDRSKEETGDTKELAGGKANNLDRVGRQNGRVTLRIVEVDMLRMIH